MANAVIVRFNALEWPVIYDDGYDICLLLTREGLNTVVLIDNGVGKEHGGEKIHGKEQERKKDESHFGNGYFWSL